MLIMTSLAIGFSGCVIILSIFIWLSKSKFNILFNETHNRFSDHLHLIYQSELEIKDTTDTDKSASYLDLFLEMTTDCRLNTKIDDKRDDFNFPIVNFPFLCSTSQRHQKLSTLILMNEEYRFLKSC